MARILVIGDIHEPAAHVGYKSFCQDLAEKWSTSKTVFIGDIMDWHAISFHAHHPDCPGPSDEFELAARYIKEWHDAFPRAKVCIGNHDERIVRLAESVNIPSRFLRNYSSIWKTPGWKWDYDHVIDDIYFFHGVGQGGVYPAYNACRKMLMSVVMGHIHTAAGVKWMANPTRRIFAMDTGCGINVRAYQFAYGKHATQKPVLGAGVIIDGVPYHEVMPIGRGEKYSSANFPKRDLWR